MNLFTIFAGIFVIVLQMSLAGTTEDLDERSRELPNAKFLPLTASLTDDVRRFWQQSCKTYREKCEFADDCCTRKCMKKINRCTI